MGRQPCCDKIGLKRGPWTIDEDQKLINFIISNGIQCWRLVPKLAGLMRCGKSCRLRWTNYLRPDLKRGALTEAEEDRIIQLHALLGNRWSKIASYFPGRTDNEIKNHWNTRIKKRMKLQGVDPVTHKPINEEQPRTCNLHERNAVESSPSKVEEKSGEIDLMNLVDACLQEFPTMDDDDDDDDKKRPSMTEVGFHGNMGAETNPNKNSCSTSFSLEEDALHEDSSTLIGWDDAFGGVSSWEALCHLEDVFPFCSYP